MVWTVPKTAVDGETLTAAEYNTYIRDNLLETHPAKATLANRGALFCGTGTNSGAERLISEGFISTQQQRSSSSYGDLATVGPSVTVNTGERCLVWLYCQMSNTTTNSSYMSYAISGATTLAASDDTALRRQDTGNFGGSTCHLAFDLTPGSNTFTAKYRVAAGTGDFWERRIIVLPM